MNDDLKMRFRYSLSLDIPINKKVMEKNAIYASAYNEIFINTTSQIITTEIVFMVVLVIVLINDHIKVEAGVMSQLLTSW